jgi:hypothetical protein
MSLRFPNPGSDVSRLIHIYRLIYAGTKQKASFYLDEMSRILTTHLQASSRGAVGAEALSRSSETDRSRDPLYNQSKSYSEVFRMLGWLRPGNQRLEFRSTLLGDQIAEEFASRNDLTNGLLRECLLGITFPNPATNNVGVANQRPFRWLLLLTAELGGVITRHEMIIGLLAVADDLRPREFEAAVERVRRARRQRSDILEAVRQQAKQSSIQVVTLENYTRFPVGVLKSSNVGWATSQRMPDLYERPTEALVLTTLGRATAEALRTSVDVREASLEKYSMADRAAFANYGYYAMLLRSGVDYAQIGDALTAAERGCRSIMEGLDISNDPSALLYSPIQQAPDAVLAEAQEQ